ncbi:hybrid sensor histidine kinase/response regulator [Desulfobulbus oralis]|uniref:hybrid sensor histidine kinase/response regulator n=1 Tax=Desulfobulbus oralis TaxID=1986146 RepID=UPI0011B047A9|nr:response regulator [Desulfobulbus oralis]
MKLNDLIEALAGEIELMKPHLDESLEQLATLGFEDNAFIDAMDQYSGQVQRMGEAAEMAGFPGLQAVCTHVLDNTLLLASQTAEERKETVEFLHNWPDRMVYYLRHTEDPSAAAGLVDMLCRAPSPMEEEQALKVTYQLGVMPAQLKGPAAGGAENLRPLLAHPEDVALVLPEDVDPKVIEGFLQEAPGQAAHLIRLIRSIVAGSGDGSDLTAAKRVAHTLKGSGAIIGLKGLVSLGHNLEDILEYFELHQEDNKVGKTVGDILLDGAYCLEQMVNYVNGSDEYPQQAQSVLQGILDLANLIDRGDDLSQLVRRAPAGGGAQMPVPAVSTSPVPGIKAVGGVDQGTAATLRVNLKLIEELFRISGEVSVTSAAMEASLKKLGLQARELVRQNLRVQRRLMELENLVDIRALTMMRARNRRAEDTEFDPLEMDQYSELHSTTHALAEETGDLRVLTHALEGTISSVSAIQSRQQIFSRDLQHLVNGTRMTEVGVLETRLQRNVRTTAKATGKEAVLELKGGDTLIDSDVLNKLAEPLLHLLRNAVDHGLESPEDRIACGKPPAGHITLSFALQGQQIALRCSDDGRGLDYDAIAKRGVEKGLIPARHTDISEEELARLILAPGFSTNTEVTEISGRGVGLDVVHEWVSDRHGTMQVFSRPGEGCTFELHFAASLSTVYSIIVGLGEHRYALPSISVSQAVPRGAGSFDRLGGQLFYRQGEKAMVALFMADLVGLPLDPEKPLNDYDVIIVHLADKTRALLVDSLVDARELLVVYPGRFGRHARGVAGLSILGDGSVAVDIDVPQLLAGAVRKTQAPVRQDAGAEQAAQRQGRKSVLVVDDALTVRNSLQELLTDAGFDTGTAKDGMEAVSMLDTLKPDIVLTDLEMPNMNGIELTSYIRNKEETKNLPVIMITSRSLEKHRALADSAGVNQYITKPYNDNDLLKVINRALATAA